MPSVRRLQVVEFLILSLELPKLPLIPQSGRLLMKKSSSRKKIMLAPSKKFTSLKARLNNWAKLFLLVITKSFLLRNKELMKFKILTASISLKTFPNFLRFGVSMIFNMMMKERLLVRPCVLLTNWVKKIMLVFVMELI